MTDEKPPNISELPGAPGMTQVEAPSMDQLQQEASPHTNITISDDEFKLSVLKALHTISNHACALALSSKQPDRNKQGRLVPMNQQDQMYHTAMQHDLNVHMDKLLGWADYAEKMKPTLAVDNTDAPPEPKLDTSFLNPDIDPDSGDLKA